jgi:streptomycin 6-kinase
MSLEHYLQAWSLAQPQLIAQTPTSHVYTVSYQGETAVLKLLSPMGALEEGAGALALRHYDGHGAVRLLRHDEGAHLLEYADGEDLKALVLRGEDERATQIIADVLNHLHHRRDQLPALKPLRQQFRSLFAKADTDQRAGDASIYVRAAHRAQQLFDQPQDVCVLHGDVHHENIRWREGRGWLVFDPKGLIGERAFDAANTLYNPIEMPDIVIDEARLRRNAAILAHDLNLDLGRLYAFAFVYGCLSAAWFLEDQESPDQEIAVASIIEGWLES